MLDPHTLMFVMLLNCLLMAASLAALTLRKPWPGLQPWCVSLFVQGIGWLLMLIAFSLAIDNLFGAGTVLLVAGMVLQVHAVDRFGGHDTQWTAPLAVAATVAVAYAYPGLSAPLRMGVAVCGFTVLRLLALRSLLRIHDLRGSRVLRLMVIVLGLSVVVLGARAVELLSGSFGAEPIASPMLRTIYEVLAFSVGYAVVVVTTFGLLLLHRERADAELRQLAERDSLTGLLNRRTFLQLAGRRVQRARNDGEALTLMILDLDHFKRINDQFGHPAGDRVLCDFAEVMLNSLRRNDLVGRFGGEEFAVLLMGVDLSGGLVLSERLRTATERRWVEPEGIRYTVSIGLAELDPYETSGLTSLISRADRALYRAKGEGRNRSALSPIGAG